MIDGRIQTDSGLYFCTLIDLRWPIPISEGHWRSVMDNKIILGDLGLKFIIRTPYCGVWFHLNGMFWNAGQTSVSFQLTFPPGRLGSRARPVEYIKRFGFYSVFEDERPLCTSRPPGIFLMNCSLCDCFQNVLFVC